MLKPDFVYQCECGAITLTFGEKEYYVSKKNLQTFFPNLDLDGVPTQKTYACNHCVNHWGLDLCGCGSGEKVDECECGLGIPYQTIDGENYRSPSSWI